MSFSTQASSDKRFLVKQHTTLLRQPKTQRWSMQSFADRTDILAEVEDRSPLAKEIQDEGTEIYSILQYLYRQHPSIETF